MSPFSELAINIDNLQTLISGERTVGCDIPCEIYHYYDYDNEDINYYYLKTILYNSYQYKVAGSEPRLSSTNWTRLVVSHTLISVPLTEAVATIVPCWFKAIHANSPWWAFIVTGALDIPASVFAKSCTKCNKCIPNVYSTYRKKCGKYF